MKNKIVCREVSKEGYCLICGKPTRHEHFEKLNRENRGRVCDDCCKGPVSIKKEEVIEYYCPECEETITNPVKGAGGMLFCPADFCGSPVQQKE